MKITDIKLTKVTVPLHNTLRMGIDRAKTTNSCAILEVETDEGIVGISESPFDPERTEFEINRLKSRFIGEEPFNIEKIVGFDPYIGELYKTISAVEIACWDIIGKKLGVPVYKLLGGKVWDKLQVTLFMSFDDPETIASEAVEAVEKGFTTIKLKLGLDPNQDLEIVKTVREAVGEKPLIRIDPNQSWSVPTAINLLNRMEQYNIQYVEQPTPRWDHDGLIKLSQRTNIPICICEGLTSMPETMRLIKRNAVDFISTDPIRMGGLMGFKKLCGIAEAEGIPVIAHVSSLGISVATWLHAVVSSRATMFAHDICYPGLEYGAWGPVGDIIKQKFNHENGFLEVSDEPGLGVELDREAMAKWNDYYKKLQKETTKEDLIYRYGNSNSPTSYLMPPRY